MSEYTNIIHYSLCPYGQRGINIDVASCSLCDLIATVRAATLDDISAAIETLRGS